MQKHRKKAKHMAILITGGTGFIGSHTVVEFLEAGREVVIVDNFCNSKPVVLDRIKQITGIRPRFYEVDLLDKCALRAVFSGNQIGQRDSLCRAKGGGRVLRQAACGITTTILPAR